MDQAEACFNCFPSKPDSMGNLFDCGGHVRSSRHAKAAVKMNAQFSTDEWHLARHRVVRLNISMVQLNIGPLHISTRSMPYDQVGHDGSACQTDLWLKSYAEGSNGAVLFACWTIALTMPRNKNELIYMRLD